MAKTCAQWLVTVVMVTMVTAVCYGLVRCFSSLVAQNSHFTDEKASLRVSGGMQIQTKCVGSRAPALTQWGVTGRTVPTLSPARARGQLCFLSTDPWGRLTSREPFTCGRALPGPWSPQVCDSPTRTAHEPYKYNCRKWKGYSKTRENYMESNFSFQK